MSNSWSALPPDQCHRGVCVCFFFFKLKLNDFKCLRIRKQNEADGRHSDGQCQPPPAPQHPRLTNVQLRPQKLSNEPRKARALIWACYCRACAVWFRLNTSTTQGEWKQSGFSNGFLFDSLFPQTDSELNNEFERAVKRGHIEVQSSIKMNQNGLRQN